MSGYAAEIQPTMVRTVAWVRSLGFETTDSGDGVTNVDAGMEGAMSVPHVVARVPTHALVAYADVMWGAVRVRGLDRRGATVEAVYGPGDGVATVVIYGVTDANLDP